MVVTQWFGVAEPLLFLVCERRSCFLVLSITNLFLITAKKSQKWTWQGNGSQCCCLFKALDALWPLYQWCPKLHLLNVQGCDSPVQNPSACLAGTPSCTLFLLMPKAWTRWSTCWQTWRCSPGYQVWEHNICLKTESQSRTLSRLESTLACAYWEASELSCTQWVFCVVVVISCFLSYRWRNWDDSDGRTVWAGRLEYETWSRACPHRNDPRGKTLKSPCCYV